MDVNERKRRDEIADRHYESVREWNEFKAAFAALLRESMSEELKQCLKPQDTP